tara:strand:- start:25002 stop:25190 length:189 start_codon:yes stop_codon:yes gene_type:complete
MGIVTRGPKEDDKIKWTIKDTEFIVRLMSNTSIPGSDIEQAAETLTKVKMVHKRLLEKEETI